jgi:hypothetical protein
MEINAYRGFVRFLSFTNERVSVFRLRLLFWLSRPETRKFLIRSYCDAAMDIQNAGNSQGIFHDIISKNMMIGFFERSG